MKTVLQKIFTREYPIILCQIWGRRYKHIFGQDLKTRPRNVFVCHNGLVEVYRSASVNNDVSAILLVNFKKDKNFISNFLQEYKNKISVFKKYFRDKNFTKKKFINFLDLILDFWPAIFMALYLPMDKRFPAVDRQAAMAFRKKIADLEYEIFQHLDIFLKNLYQAKGDAARYIYLEELASGGIPSQKILYQRQKEKLFVVDDEILTFTQFRKLQKRFDFKLETSVIRLGVKEIKGQTACTGKVRGQVQLVMKNQDVSLFKVGRVLISSMTVPTFLPAMKKAVAFVTDEGGITCHAAIVARELKKPCIIGTKIATKVFKDGDLVEVDADKGIVRKLRQI